MIHKSLVLQGFVDSCNWQLSAGMAVELVPATVLTSMSQQLSISQLGRAGSTLQHAARFAIARAAGLLLMSEVLAAEVDGTPLPEDLPQLLVDVVADTAVPCQQVLDTGVQHNAGPGDESACMWRHAAILAVSCGTVLQQLQLQPGLTAVFDEAARWVMPEALLSKAHAGVT